MEGDAYLLLETGVETAQQCSATGEPYTVLHDVGVELWRCVLKCLKHGVLYLCHRLVDAVG